MLRQSTIKSDITIVEQKEVLAPDPLFFADVETIYKLNYITPTPVGLQPGEPTSTPDDFYIRRRSSGARGLEVQPACTTWRPRAWQPWNPETSASGRLAGRQFCLDFCDFWRSPEFLGEATKGRPKKWPPKDVQGCRKVALRLLNSPEYDPTLPFKETPLMDPNKRDLHRQSRASTVWP